MTESASLDRDEEPKILVLRKDNQGVDYIRVGEHTRGRDVIATLNLYTRQEVIGSRISGLLRTLFAGGFFNNKTIGVKDPIGDVSSQTKFVRSIQFGESPTLDDLEASIKLVYGEEALLDQEMQFLAQAIDEGHITDLRISFGSNTPENELTSATNDQIKNEMKKMTDEFYGVSE